MGGGDNAGANVRNGGQAEFMRWLLPRLQGDISRP
jgi:hypothetical protein